jgi:hypothetical protein
LPPTVRAIGRGFGNGTLDFSAASVSHDEKNTASASVVTMAVDRNATARASGVTVLLLWRIAGQHCPYVYFIEYSEKTRNTLARALSAP